MHFVYQCVTQVLSGISFWMPICPLARTLQLLHTEHSDSNKLFGLILVVFTLYARLDSSQHLSLSLFSNLYAYDQIIAEVSLPPICSLLLQFKSSPAACWDKAVVNRKARLCIYISGRGGKPTHDHRREMMHPCWVCLWPRSCCSHTTVCWILWLMDFIQDKKLYLTPYKGREPVMEKCPQQAKLWSRQCFSGPFTLLLKAPLLLPCSTLPSSLKAISESAEFLVCNYFLSSNWKYHPLSFLLPIIPTAKSTLCLPFLKGNLFSHHSLPWLNVIYFSLSLSVFVYLFFVF